jgi:hypothetical protein
VTRRYLDPGLANGSPSGPVIEQLPKRVRDFGYFPDLSKLRPGDLLLVCPLKAELVAVQIQASQKHLHSQFDAQWVHAAAYLGDESIVELDAGGVRINEISKYIPTHRLLFRRLLDSLGQPVDELAGHKVAVAALKAFQTRYNGPLLPEIWVKSRIFKRDYRVRPKSKEAICSTFYDNAVVRVLGTSAVSAKHSPFTPADLASSTRMIDVDVAWLRLP